MLFNHEEYDKMRVQFNAFEKMFQELDDEAKEVDEEIALMRHQLRKFLEGNPTVG